MTVGYGFTDGHKTSPDELAAIFNGMAINGLLTHSRILTGYIPSAQALGVVADRIRRMKTDNPSLIYLLDRELCIDVSIGREKIDNAHSRHGRHWDRSVCIQGCSPYIQGNVEYGYDHNAKPV